MWFALSCFGTHLMNSWSNLKIRLKFWKDFYFLPAIGANSAEISEITFYLKHVHQMSTKTA